MTNLYLCEISMHGDVSQGATGSQPFHSKDASTLPGCIQRVLSAKDKAILKALSHFVRWAGRYPDPGFGKQSHAEEIFALSEGFQISAKDLFGLAARIMQITLSITAPYIAIA